MNKTKGGRVTVNDQHIACDQCALDDICSPVLIGEQNVSPIQNMLKRRTPVKAGEYLFKEGEPLQSIHAITLGTFKLVRTNSKGLQRIVGFRFPGELIGDDALATKAHELGAIALDQCSICHIPITEFENTATIIPGFQQNLIDLLSTQCLTIQRQFSAYAGRNNAEGRLAAFIMNISERCALKDKPDKKIYLAMSRDDIADFLGLRQETLSRTFSRFQKNKIIDVSARSIEIKDILALQTLAND